MTQSSWPFEGVDTTETQYSRLLRNIGQGVNGVPGDNNLLAYADSSGMNVKVKVAGGNSQAIVRGHMYQSTAEETLTISSANTSPRIDAVVLRLDPSVNSIVLAVVTGTPAPSPSAPTLTQTDTAIYELLIGYVAVPASTTTISAGNVTDKRTFIGNVWTTANRPSPTLGLTGYNTTIGKLESYGDTGWEVVTPTSLDASVISSGTLDSARLGTIPVGKGGTGATDAAGARTNLGVTPANIGAATASHTHDATAVISGSFDSARIPNLDASKIQSGILPLAFGGTGSNTAAGARSALNITAGTIPNGAGTATIQQDMDFVSANAINANSNAAQAKGGSFDIAVWNRDVSGMTRYAAWIGNNGQVLLGQTASSERFKTNITADTGIDPLKVLELDVVLYQNKERLKEAESNPYVHVGTDVGMIAERLHEAGLWQFVIYERDEKNELILNKKGEPIPHGIHYELWALAVHVASQHVWREHLKLADRVAALESLIK